MLRRSVWRHHPGTVVLPRYDVCIVGGGPAGIRAAMRAVDFKKKVCLIEKDRIGGADFFRGALQSKTMWEMSRFCSKVKKLGPRMFKESSLGAVRVDEANVRKELERAASTREKQMLDALRNAGVDIIQGTGAFADPHRIHVTTSTSQDKHVINADYYVIATGSKPRPHPTIAVNGVTIVSSDHIMSAPFPKSLVIVGAGVIGCEFASIFAHFGQTQVNIIEKGKRMLPREDVDISKYVQDLLTNRGVKFHHQCALVQLESVEPTTDEERLIARDGGPYVRYKTKHLITGAIEEHRVERALVSIGRDACYDNLGLTTVGAIIKNGTVEVDDFQRVKPHEHIYAIGDATADIALVNMGEKEAIAAIEHMYSQEWVENTREEIDNLSTIMFLDEEVAGVGLSEAQCVERNIGYISAKYDYSFVSRALAMGSTNGFIKIIATNDREKRVLGVRAVGEHASSIVDLASLAVHRKQSAYDLAETVTAYPAVTQGFQECVRVLLDVSMMKPTEARPQVSRTPWNPQNFERGRVYQQEEKRVKSTEPPYSKSKVTD